MQSQFSFALLLVISLAANAVATVTTSSYQTGVLTNAYAPLDQSAYFDKRILTSVSPATVSVADDWTGTNFGGISTTWRWVGSAHASFTTSSDVNGLTVAGAGSFNYGLTTTVGFVDPTKVTTLYGPASAADYQCAFTVDSAVPYSVSVQLQQSSLIQLVSVTNGLVFRQRNFTATPFPFSMNGILLVGQYQLLVNASSGPPSGLFNGINNEAGSGGFENFVFTARIPEPSCACLGWIVAIHLLRRQPARGHDLRRGRQL